jgi:hypothetical protein
MKKLTTNFSIFEGPEEITYSRYNLFEDFLLKILYDMDKLNFDLIFKQYRYSTWHLKEKMLSKYLNLVI